MSRQLSGRRGHQGCVDMLLMLKVNNVRVVLLLTLLSMMVRGGGRCRS